MAPAKKSAAKKKAPAKKAAAKKKAPAKKAPAKKAPAKKAPDEEGSGQEGAGQEEGSGEEGSGQEGAGEEGSGQEGAGEEGSGQEGSGEEGSGQEGARQEGPGQEEGARQEGRRQEAGVAPTRSGRRAERPFPRAAPAASLERRPPPYRPPRCASPRGTSTRSRPASPGWRSGWATPSPTCCACRRPSWPTRAFPALTFEALGYEAAHHGEGRWNGVAILSRVGLDDVVAGFGDDDEPDPQARLLWATCGGVRVAQRLRPQRAVARRRPLPVQAGLARAAPHPAGRGHDDPTEPLVVAGDFNIAPTDDDVWDPAAFEGATHVSEPERAALGALVDWGLADTFRRVHHEPGLYSWWDYRAGNFHKRKGMRIDLLLGTPSVADGVQLRPHRPQGPQGQPTQRPRPRADRRRPGRRPGLIRRHRRWPAPTPPAPSRRRVASQTDEDLTPRRVALRRIAAANRDLIEDMVGTDVDPVDLEAVATELEALAVRFRHERPRSSYEGMAETAMSGGQISAFFDHSPLIGLANPLAPPIRVEVGEDLVLGRVSFGAVYEGPPGCVHGGFVAAAFDEILGTAQTFSGAPGMTARLVVNYRKPTPLHAPLVFEGRFDRREGRKVFTTGRVLADGVVTAEAEGLFVTIDATKFRELAAGFDRRVSEDS